VDNHTLPNQQKPNFENMQAVSINTGRAFSQGLEHGIIKA